MEVFPKGKTFIHNICLTLAGVAFRLYRAKRTKFGWKYTHDVWLLTEAISIDPYRWKHGSRERGEAFMSVAANLKQIPYSRFPSSLNQRFVNLSIHSRNKKRKKKEQAALMQFSMKKQSY